MGNEQKQTKGTKRLYANCANERELIWRYLLWTCKHSDQPFIRFFVGFEAIDAAWHPYAAKSFPPGNGLGY